MGLKKQLAGKLPDNVLPYVSDHFEVIGDIAVLALRKELEPYRKIIATTLAGHRKNIYTVLNKKEKITGTVRTAKYEILLGETTVTEYREFGFTYLLDVRQSFFSAKMAYERQRVTGQVEPGERVCIPFAGIGPFVIPAAARGGRVTAVEKSPETFRWLVENVRLNHVDKNCRILRGDVFDCDLLPDQHFDRIILPAPYGMDHALDVMLPLVSEGGMVHFYTFKPEEAIPDLLDGYKRRGLTLTYYAPCGNVAPGIHRWVFDLAR